jgi:shikimate kinase
MNRRIVILGFMACGKTSVGRELARQLEYDFIDLDSFITQRSGRSPAEIIQQDGEDNFRDIETLALRDVLQNESARVIALGGGTWTIPANRTLIALHDCVSIWLDASFDLCWQRIVDGTGPMRPLAPSRANALSRYEARRDDYALAEHKVVLSVTDNLETIANRILPLC